MKLLLALSMLTFTTISFACTDFSGNYIDDDSNPYSIIQTGCESLKLGDVTLVTDGYFRLKEETTVIKILSASNHIDDYLQVEVLLDYKIAFPAEMPIELIPFKYVVIYTIGWKDNLAIDTTVYNKSGDVISSDNTIHQKL